MLIGVWIRLGDTMLVGRIVHCMSSLFLPLTFLLLTVVIKDIDDDTSNTNRDKARPHKDTKQKPVANNAKICGIHHCH